MGLNHSLVLGLLAFDLALRRVGFPRGQLALGFGARTEAGHICTMIPSGTP